MGNADVIVAGAGIIGLSVALELARKGLKVQVLEKGRAMAEASWAAAGMLAANDPEHPAALREMATLSGRLYPDYLRIVEELSGRVVPLRTRSTLLAGPASQPLHGAADPTKTDDAVEVDEVLRRIPGVSTEGRRFWWMEEASLDPRDLCVALPDAVAAAGATIELDTAVLAVKRQGNSIAVTTTSGTLPTRNFVNCCGAWAGQVEYAGVDKATEVRVEPRKGQMLCVQLPAPLDLPCVVRTPEIYLVPRGGGRVVIGATVERTGFDRRVDPEALATLRGLAAAVWPPIGSGSIAESWSGLRPGTADELPFIGSAGIAGCWVATGHFRNGILLAPATALLVRQLIQGAKTAIDLSAFAPSKVTRFEAVGYKTDRPAMSG